MKPRLGDIRDRKLVMDIKPVRTKADYRAALKQIEKLMNAKANTAEGEKLDVLVTLVEAYEPKQASQFVLLRIKTAQQSHSAQAAHLRHDPLLAGFDVA